MEKIKKMYTNTPKECLGLTCRLFKGPPTSICFHQGFLPNCGPKLKQEKITKEEYTQIDIRWRAYCTGSEGYQVRPDNSDLPAAKVKEELKKRLTPIAYLDGPFMTQKANAYLIAKAPEMLKKLKEIEHCTHTLEGLHIFSDSILMDSVRLLITVAERGQERGE